jgi:hypothetical protein
MWSKSTLREDFVAVVDRPMKGMSFAILYVALDRMYELLRRSADRPLKGTSLANL